MKNNRYFISKFGSGTSCQVSVDAPTVAEAVKKFQRTYLGREVRTISKEVWRAPHRRYGPKTAEFSADERAVYEAALKELTGE